uniref:Thrombospondin-like N-terminal domain-containing protein n=1 Tax=Anopheles atroparvus TaxID=41427 RepID=A0A182JDN5_ANOAO
MTLVDQWLCGTIVTLICIAHRVTSSELNIFGGQGIRDALAERDLMAAIQIPLQNGVKFVDGLDGFPAFGVTSEADLKSPFRLILSDHLQDFAIIATVRPQSSSGGWVFSVVNSLDTVVQLGLLLEPTAAGDQWNVTLYYTDAKQERDSQALASFQVPYGKSWMKMIFKVLPDQIVFYYNCLEAGVVPVKKEPRKLVFDTASTVYIGQAGPVLKRKFELKENERATRLKRVPKINTFCDRKQIRGRVKPFSGDKQNEGKILAKGSKKDNRCV